MKYKERLGLQSRLIRNPKVRILVEHLRKVAMRGNDEVEIHLPNANPVSDARKISRLENAIKNYYASVGARPHPQENSGVEIASWHFREFFERMKPTLRREAGGLYREGKEAIRRVHIDMVGAESFSKRASATAELLSAISQFDEAVMRLGDVVIAKAVINGKTRLITETISPEMAREFEKNPAIIRNPTLYFKAFHPHLLRVEEPLSDLPEPPEPHETTG